MFLVKGLIPSEPVWRQFLENAGKLTLKAKTFKHPSTNLKKKFKNGMHPPINGLEEARYPGYKIQHGLVPPSKYRSTDYPHVKRRLTELETIQGIRKPNFESLSVALEDTSEAPRVRSEQMMNITSRPAHGWRNASNAGCKGEEEKLYERANFLHNGVSVIQQLLLKIRFR